MTITELIELHGGRDVVKARLGGEDAILAAASDWDSAEGVCLACGSETSGVEPDAEGYPCDACGENAVCGWEQAGLALL